jgi:hypothetical protein
MTASLDQVRVSIVGLLGRHTGIQMGVSYLTKNGDRYRTFPLRNENTLAGNACRRHNDLTINARTRTKADAIDEYRVADAAVPCLGVLQSAVAGNPLDT